VAIGKTEEIVYAEKGRGARMLSRNGDVAVKVNTGNNMIWFDGRSERAANAVQNAMLSERWYVCMFPSSVTAAYVAIGRLGALIQFGMSVPSNRLGSVHWSAGCLVASEAGAIVTDLDTHGEWTLATRNLLIAASRALHDELCDVVDKAR
jgi:fructose-1,6-bisphosphatase/inositol monophosphatase family enzyme